MVYKIYRKTYEELKAKKLLMGVADEGGFGPADNSEEILKFLSKIIEKCNLKALSDVSIALDVANNFKTKLGYNFLKKELLTQMSF